MQIHVAASRTKRTLRGDSDQLASQLVRSPTARKRACKSVAYRKLGDANWGRAPTWGNRPARARLTGLLFDFPGVA